jgi:hypothetical protein
VLQRLGKMLSCLGKLAGARSELLFQIGCRRLARRLMRFRLRSVERSLRPCGQFFAPCETGSPIGVGRPGLRSRGPSAET